MAIVKPFRGIRPPKELVEKVESRPYDVLDSEEARAEAGDNEMSLYHIIKPEIDFPVGTSEYDPRVYERAAENFQKFQDKGWLVQDKQDHYYIYAQTMGQKTQYGLVVGAYVDDYIEAGRRLPGRDVVLQTLDADYYLFKSDILSGMVTYSTDKNLAANVETITAERAREIIDMNRRGEKPESLQEGGKAKPQKTHVDLAQGDISRFDKAKKKKKKKKPQQPNKDEKK